MSLRGYWRDREFCGFTLSVCSDKYLYINFIAVSPELRSEGVGTEILRHLAGTYPDKAMLVEVLSPAEGSHGWEQRNRRLEFYRRNGFFDLGRTVSGKGGDYVLLSTDAVYDREAYWRIFDHMSFKSIFRFKGSRKTEV